MADTPLQLPLTPFEKYMLWDERPRQPMNIFAELRFATALDESRVRLALQQATRKHPLLACKLEFSRKEPCWRYESDFVPELLCGTSSTPTPVQPGQTASLNLSEGGFRVWHYTASPVSDIVREGTNTSTPASRLLFQFHHALVDGVGVRRYLIDFLAAYANPEASGFDGTDLSLMQFRYDFTQAIQRQIENPISGWQRVKNAYYFHFQTPRPIVGQPREDTVQPHCPLRHLTFSLSDSERILEKSRKEEIGLNDLALSLLLTTAANWLHGQGDASRRSRLRVMFPFDLRTRSELKMPAANKLSFAFIGRTLAECQDWGNLLPSVAAETAAIKKTALPLDLLNGFNAIASSPRLMRSMIAINRHMASAVLTYTGDISRGTGRQFPIEDDHLVVGDARLTHILAAPPTRRNTNIALGLSLNWGRICLSANWNREKLSRFDCEAFLRSYQQQWFRWVGAD